MVNVGSAARYLRDRLGLTQRALAEQLGISCVHLCNIEKNKVVPSATLLERYRELWGVDLYVLGWCENGDDKKLPKSVRDAASALAEAWKAEIEEALEARCHRTTR